MMVLLFVVVFVLIMGLFVFFGMCWNVFIVGVVIYLLFGGFVVML